MTSGIIKVKSNQHIREKQSPAALRVSEKRNDAFLSSRRLQLSERNFFRAKNTNTVIETTKLIGMHESVPFDPHNQ